MSEQLVVLNEDQKAVVLKELKELYHAAAHLYESVNKDNLSLEMRRVLCSLCESHIGRASVMLHYDSDLAKEREERFIEIRAANMRIHELERQLGCCDITNILPQKLKSLSSSIRDWWRKDGFGHVSDISFTEYGYVHVRLCCLLMNHNSSWSDKPVTQAKTREQWIEDLKGRWHLFQPEAREWSPVLDNHNRDELMRTIKARFPSAAMTEIRGHMGRKPEMVMREAEFMMYSLSDIETVAESSNQSEE